MSESPRPPKYGTRRPMVDRPVLYRPDNHKSEYSAPSTEKRIDFNGTVDFIFSEHTPGNLSHSLELVQETNPGIIAIESPGITEEERIQAEAEINRIIHAAAPHAIMTQGFNQLATHHQTIASALFGSEATIKLIDINSDDPDFVAIVAPALEAETESIRNEDDPSLYNQYIELYARSNAFRESLMTEQITEILLDNPDKNVAVLLGAAHTPVHHAISQIAPSARIFDPEPRSKPWATGEKMTYPDATKDIRAARFKLVGQQSLREHQ